MKREKQLVYKIKWDRHALKYVKKIKEKTLKEKIMDIIYKEIAIAPYTFERKSGGLNGYFTYKFIYHKIAYRIAYTIESNVVIVNIVLVGPHEGFYEHLKRFIK